MENAKKLFKDGKDWITDHKELVMLVGLSTSALTTYIMYKSFETKPYNDFKEV